MQRFKQCKFDLCHITLKQMFTSKLPIPNGKDKGYNLLLDSEVIPNVYNGFYTTSLPDDSTLWDMLPLPDMTEEDKDTDLILFHLAMKIMCFSFEVNENLCNIYVYIYLSRAKDLVSACIDMHCWIIS